MKSKHIIRYIHCHKFETKLLPISNSIYSRAKCLYNNPPLLGLPDHALHVLNHDRTDHNTKTNGALVHSNYSVIHLLLYDVITSLANRKIEKSQSSFTWRVNGGGAYALIAVNAPIMRMV